MSVTVNGESRQVGEGATIASLLCELKLLADKVAVELNRRLVRGEKYDTPLRDGDVLEIVTFVGGG